MPKTPRDLSDSELATELQTVSDIIRQDAADAMRSGSDSFPLLTRFAAAVVGFATEAARRLDSGKEADHA